MFDWFKEAAIKKGMSNIKHKTVKLVKTSNSAHLRLRMTASPNSQDVRAISSLQRGLLADMQWAHSVGVSPSEIFHEMEKAIYFEQVSDGAILALDHVYNTFRREIDTK